MGLSRSWRAFMSLTVVVLVAGVVACVPEPAPDPCADNVDHFIDGIPTTGAPPMSGWYRADTGSAASVELTDEFGAPPGSGCHAAKFDTGAPAGDEANRAELVSFAKTFDRLSDVEQVRYRTYRSSTSSTDHRVTVGIQVDIASFFAPGSTTSLHYEPHRQSAGPAGVLEGSWQLWDATAATAGNGLWWSAEHGPSELFTWVGIQQEYPDATILAHGFEVRGAPDQVLAADGLVFGDLTTNLGASKPDRSTPTTTTTTTTTLDLPDPRSDLVAVGTGMFFSCAVTDAGEVRCWGYNGGGQLGDGTTRSSRTGVAVAGIDDAVDIAVGQSHACALTQGGAVKCWGSNLNGGLGDGTTTNSSTPVDVVGLDSGAVALSAGSSYACAVLEDTTAKCWGDNHDGQLGNGEMKIGYVGPNVFSTVPVEVEGLDDMVQITTGPNNTCARTGSGEAWCWGDNGGTGKLGDGTTERRPLPVRVQELTGTVQDISAGWQHSCAVTTTGAWCWGGNEYGELGNGLSGWANRSFLPVQVQGLGGPASSVLASTWQTCVVLGSGGVQCWGADHHGRLGNGAPLDDLLVPDDVTGLSAGVEALAASQRHNCALVDGGIKCWGHNKYGELGDGTGTDRYAPVDAHP